MSADAESAGQHGRIDVAAGYDYHGGASLKVHLAGENGGQRGRAAGLGDQLELVRRRRDRREERPLFIAKERMPGVGVRMASASDPAIPSLAT